MVSLEGNQVLTSFVAINSQTQRGRAKESPARLARVEGGSSQFVNQRVPGLSGSTPASLRYSQCTLLRPRSVAKNVEEAEVIVVGGSS